MILFSTISVSHLNSELAILISAGFMLSSLKTAPTVRKDTEHNFCKFP